MNSAFVFFTGAACSLLVLAAVKLAHQFRHVAAGRWLVVVLVGVTCYLLEAVLPPLPQPAAFLLDIPSILVPAAFWLFAFHLCNDGEAFPHWSWMVVGIALLVDGLANSHLLTGISPFLHDLTYWLSQPLKLGLLGAGMVTLIRQYQSDLVEARRSLRLALMAVIGGYMVIVVCADFLFSYWPVPSGLPALHAILASLLSMAACLWLLDPSARALQDSLQEAPSVAAQIAAPSEDKPAPESPPEPLDDSQQQLIAQLTAHMENGGYRHTGLTIRELAEQLGAREHVLRALINRHLGYRNFNEYLNEYRIDEASRRLADPDQAHLPVLTIALDIGYRSLSPFNAAFKRRHEMTPTEFRRERLPVT